MSAVLITVVFIAVYWTIARLCLRWNREASAAAPSSSADLTAAAQPEPTVVRGSRRLAARECDTVWRLMTGDVDRTEYRETMAVLAAKDAVAHPLAVPRLHG